MKGFKFVFDDIILRIKVQNADKTEISNILFTNSIEINLKLYNFDLSNRKIHSA